MSSETDETLPISALAHLLYCERRAALVHVVGVWVDNEHTVAGDALHTRVDSGEATTRPGVRILRTLHVRSDQLGLSGILDAVEVHDTPAGRRLLPIETKKGKRRKWARDDVQLCAIAMALEEMTGVSITEGAIFHGESKRRRVVHFTRALRAETAAAAARLRAIIREREVPKPVADERCPSCSLEPVCQPRGLFPVGSLKAHVRRAFE